MAPEDASEAADAVWAYEAQAADDGERLDRVLSRAAQDHAMPSVRALSRERLKDLIAQGLVGCASAGTARVFRQAAARVRLGDALRVTLPRPAPAALVPVRMPLDVLFEDADIVVLNKPAHLPVHPGAGVRRPTLVAGLLAHCGDLAGIGGVLRPGVVHRLDADTTGVMVFAKHDIAHRALSAQFAARTISKRYVALVVHAPLSSVIAPEAALGFQRLTTPFCRHPTVRQRFVGREVRGMRVREATSRIRVMGQAGQLMLVEVALETGRTHQIRVHLAETLGPVACDRLYRPQIASCAHAANERAQLQALDHHALHAYALELTHPVHNTPMRFVAPIAPSWRALAHKLAPGDEIACLAACDTQATVLAQAVGVDRVEQSSASLRAAPIHV